MLVWGWTLLVAVVCAATVCLVLVRKSLLAQLQQRDTALASERTRADCLAADAARLPDVVQRLQGMEVRASSMEAQLRDGAAREAELRARLDEAATSRAIALDDLAGARRHQAEQQHALEGARIEAKSLSAKLTAAVHDAEDLRGRLGRTEATLEGARAELREKDIALAQVTADRDAALRLVEQSRAYLETAQATMRTVFVEAASGVFDEKAAVLDRRIKETGEQAKQQLETTLKPFADQVVGFQSKVEQLTSEHTRDASNLKGAIDRLQDLNKEMAAATGDLTKALKGNAKVRGDWGEMILETVLKASGLEEGVTYRRQVSSADEESGQRRLPDVVVDMPDGRQVVIDSKVNLIAWADYHEAKTPEASNDALIRHAAALRAHLKDLADKNYPKVLGGQTLDLTVLFVPIEGALAAALEMDRSLQAEALSKRVAFASPNTLMALLKVIDRMWVRERTRENVDAIMKSADQIIDAVITFLGDFTLIEDRLRAVSKAYDTAKGHLSEGRFSVLKTAKRLVDSGVRGKKPLPGQLGDADGDDLLSTVDTPAIPLLEQTEPA